MNFKTEATETNTAYYYYSFDRDLTLIPVLTTYKYSFIITDKFSVFIGMSAGVMFEKSHLVTSYTVPAGYRIWWASADSYSPFTWGGQLGCAYDLSRHVAVAFGAKSLRVNETKAATGTYTCLYLGFRFTF